jgi:peptide/nickel transport system ATP-binding protein
VILYRGRIVEMGSTERIFDNPLHPYTKMLMASVPRLDKKWDEVEREMQTKAEPVALAEPGAGLAVAAVATQPVQARGGAALVEAEPNHFVAFDY